MRLPSLMARLARRRIEAAARAARQRTREELFPALDLTRLEDRRLLNAAPVAVSPAPTIKDDTTSTTPKLDAGNDAGAKGDNGAGDVSKLAETVYRGPANGQFTAEMRQAMQHSPHGKSSDAQLKPAATTESKSAEQTAAQQLSFNATAAVSANDIGVTETLAVNLPPVNTVPGPQTTTEDTPLAISGLSVDDPDAGSSPLVTRFEVASGSLTVDPSTPGVVVLGNGTSVVQVIGTVAQINATLALPTGVTYAPNANFNGADVLKMVTNDNGATGTGGPMVDSDTVSISVLPVNDAPVNTVPGAQSTNEDTPLAISGLSVTDIDAGSSPITTRFEVASGTLTVDPSIPGVVVLGNGTSVVQVIGTVAQINATLALPTGVTYAPNANFNGADTLKMVTNDNGATGVGGPKTDTDTVAITVAAVNDAPVNTVPGAQSTNEDTPLVISGLSVFDVDSGASPITTRFEVANGTLTVDPSIPGVVVLGNGTSVVQVIGTVAQINATLALPTALTYTPNGNYNGSDTLTMTTNDNGATGSGGPMVDTDTVDITVSSVNDAPVNTVPVAQTTNEDTPLVITGLSVTDVDAGASPITTRFEVANGTLTVDPSIPGVVVLGNGTSVVQLIGTVAEINATLALPTGLTYTPTLNYNGSDTLTMTTNDNGAIGSGGPMVDTDTVDITVVAVNDAPVNTVPGPQTTVEDTPLVISGLSVSDIDAGSSPITTQFEVANGTLTVDASIAGVVVVGNGTSVVQITGTVAQINATLALPTGVTYAPSLNYNGVDTLTMTTNDNGAMGSGGPMVDTDTVDITVTPVNDAPVNTVPGSQTTNEDTPLVITGLSVTDVDSGSSPIVTRFEVTNGTLTVDASIPGIVVLGNGTSVVQLIGTVAEINATLALPTGLTYTPTLNYNGSDTLTMTTNDNGATGSGGPMVDTDTVDITVVAVNDAPVNTVPGPQTTNEDTQVVISGLSVADVDAGASPIVTQLQVAHGTLTVDPSVAGVVVLGNGTSVVQIIGTVAQINATLALPTGVTYAPSLNYNGVDTLTMTTNDNGATGSGGPMVDTDTVAINVLPVNDAPVNTVPGPQTTNEDTPLVITVLSVTDVDSGSSPIVTRFEVTNGTLTVDPSIPGVTVLGNGTSVVQIIGTVAQINATLALPTALTYTPGANYSGSDTLTMTTNDLGATGAGGPLKDVDTVAITVNPVADTPVLTLAAPAVTGFEGTPIPLGISGMLTDTDGSEVLTFTLTNVPTIGVLHDGLGNDHTGSSTYTFTAAEIVGLTLTMPDDTGFNNFTITVTATSTEMANGDAATTAAQTLNVTILNADPTLTNLAATNTNEGSATTLTGVIGDLGTDTFTVTVDWGDGNTSVYTNLDRGAFSFTHVYADDNPTGTPSDVTPIHVQVVDDDGGMTTGDTTLIVSDVAPSIINISTVPILESQTTTLKFTITDPGPDSFHVTVDWGDGTPATVFDTPTAGDFTLTHTYLDDSPTGTISDQMPITITVLDDDTLSTTVVTTVTVTDVAPTITSLSITPTEINEQSTAFLTGTFTDPGVLDTFTLTVDWGDGTAPQVIALPAGSNSFALSHFYADDNPSGTITDLNTVKVTVTDDDTGAGVKTTTIRVDDVPPTLVNFTGTDVGSNGIVTLKGTVNDIGLQDTLTLTINWADGVQVVQNLPRGDFTISHLYTAPPNPNDPSAPITIHVTVSDDDSGAVSNFNISAVPGLGPEAGALVFFYVQPPPAPAHLFKSAGPEAEFAVLEPIALPFTTVQLEPKTQFSDAFSVFKPVVALRTVNVADGVEHEKDAVLLPVDVLNNLSELFSRLPDDHYRLYYVEQGTERLIMDVVVRRGKPIDPNDDSEGTLDRPPTSQQTAPRVPGLDPALEAQHTAETDAAAADAAAPRKPAPAVAVPDEQAMPAVQPVLPDPSDTSSIAPKGAPVAAIDPELLALLPAEEGTPAGAALNKYRQLLAPAVAAVVAGTALGNGRWAQSVDEELSRATPAALTKTARLKRRLRRTAAPTHPRTPR